MKVLLFRPRRARAAASLVVVVALVGLCTSAALAGGQRGSAKTLVVGTNIGYPPFEFYASNNQTLIGMDKDLMDALGRTLHLSVKWQNASFDSLIPSLVAGRFGVLVSAMTDNRVRQKQVSFVDYFNAGGQLVVPQGNPKHLVSLASLCGLNVAMDKGTTEYLDASKQSQRCKTSGKSAINLMTFPDEPHTLLALGSGRADAALVDSGPAAWAAKQSGGKLEVAGHPFDTGPYGIAVPKSNNSLAKSLQSGLKTLMRNGTYHRILAKWGELPGAISRVTINGGH